MSVVANQIYSPQNYLEIVTGKCFFFHLSESIEVQVNRILCDEDLGSVRSYALSDLSSLVEDGTNVVLVDMSDFNDATSAWESNLMWYEIPERCRHRLEEYTN